MISDTVNYLAARSPRLRRFIWRHVYETLSRLFVDVDWPFLSYGYVGLDGQPPALALTQDDEPHRAFVQLYHHVSGRTALTGLDVLEVSSGRGGGAAFLARDLAPRSMVGLDRAERAVAYSQRRFRRANLRFLTGDAEALPFADASFDLVLSVESSHCYGSMRRFLREVRRVLRPGGSFGWADVRDATDLATTDAAFDEAGLSPWLKEDITSNVLASLDHTDAQKRRTVQTHCPRWLVPLVHEFAGVPGSTIYGELARREKHYLHYACRRS